MEVSAMLFLVVSTPRPERPSDVAETRQSFWPWISAYEKRGVCRHIYARVGRGAVAVFDVENNNALHRILNEWADIIPTHFDTYPLIDSGAAMQMLAAQVAAKP
jgi:muconolactone delta-isomerase